jgi:hypothetical protein
MATLIGASDRIYRKSIDLPRTRPAPEHTRSLLLRDDFRARVRLGVMTYMARPDEEGKANGG